MQGHEGNIVVLISLIVLVWVCFKKRIKKTENIVAFRKAKKNIKSHKKKYKVKVINNSEIRNDIVQKGQDICYEEYINAAWKEANK